jgi:flagellar biosynthesis/type III secretory pathway M-ring protein FliF/YscJ
VTILARIWSWLRSAWAVLALALVAVWWALTERRGRQRAEARADLERDLGDVETERAKAETQARQTATDARADVETERAAHEVKARVDIAAAEAAIERVRDEHRETGAVTSESQRVFDEMRSQGRLP